MTQEEALEHLMSAENCFLTGRAGSGKSYILNKLVAALDGQLSIAVTATTGIAARNIKGETTHSFLGIGLGRKRDDKTGKWEPWDKFWQRCTYSPYFNRGGIQSCQVLVIEEISMMSSSFLSDIDRIFKLVKGNPHPFGGVKLIFLGDFLQLPPVSQGVFPPWSFKADCWKQANIKVLNLERSYRHADPVWLNILNELRMAELSATTVDQINERSVANYPKGFKGTFLMTHNKQVSDYNQERLGELPGQEKVFFGRCEGKWEDMKQLLDGITTPKNLQLKVGARVVATVNDRNGMYYNGSLGTVVDWDLERDAVYVQFEDLGEGAIPLTRFAFSNEHHNLKGNKPTAVMHQFPLRLAWALSIHSAQGCTISQIYVDATHTFAPHQLYVALSRCKTLEGVTIRGFGPEKCFVDYDAKKFYTSLQ